MCSTVVRIAEYFESPEFKGKIFTLDQFKKWYMKSQNKKKFTYYKDWSGYNIPSKELKPFLDGEFDPLNWKEKQFLEIFRNVKGRFYIICTYRRDRTEQETIDHETAHGMFWREKEYKKKVKEYLKGKDCEELVKKFYKMGYSKEVIVDETNAYLANDLPWLRKKRKLKGEQYDKYASDLNKLFKHYRDVSR
jgi:hypothetical protein